MTANAPGQFLGYAIQIPRALVHLLKSGPGDSIAIELLGDVARKITDGHLVTEEDKSSIVGNPLTDRSNELWKTFFNWVTATNDGQLKLEGTTFIIYCNAKGRPGFVNLFDAVKDEEQAKQAIAKVKEEFSNLDTDHEIFPYYDYVVNRNENIFVKLLPKFELHIGTDGVFEDVKTELRKKIFSLYQLDFLIEQLNGWLNRVIIEKIETKSNSPICWEDFESHCQVLFDRARKRELLDFTVQLVIDESTVSTQRSQHPRYLRQLEAINASDDTLVEAVSDFLRAKVNRHKWIENEIIDELVATDFETRLQRFWKNTRQLIELTDKDKHEYDRGMRLYLECKNRNETIRDMTPPFSTVAGTFHALSDAPGLGWHPYWEKQFKI